MSSPSMASTKSGDAAAAAAFSTMGGVSGGTSLTADAATW